MSAAQIVPITPRAEALPVRDSGANSAPGKELLFFYALLLYTFLLGGSAVHLYRTPVYSMDSIQYMGNALLMEERDPARVHERVYAEVERSVPKGAREHLLGRDASAPPDQNRSRQARAASAGTFAEFLPFFAIRPLYNQTLWMVSKTGVGLVKAGILISVVSYFGLGILLFFWIFRYMGSVFALAFSLVLMISPPLLELGRDTTSDALATLVAFTAAYLIFEKQRLLPGITLLLASLYFRTDFIVWAGPALLVCWWQKRLELWKAVLLGLLALASVLGINHFAGDYGMGMLYYRNFVGVPLAPAEMTVHLSFKGYLLALKSGIPLAMASFFLPFLLMGMVGLVSRRTRGLFAVALSYVFLHFAVLPNWEERWFGIFYLAMGVCAATAIAAVRRSELRNLATAE